LISGVLYIDADPTKDKIIFSNPRYKQISIAQGEMLPKVTWVKKKV
jgi:hypothetical protein